MNHYPSIAADHAAMRGQDTHSVNKLAMAEHFSSAAKHYDFYAEVQKQIAEVNIQLLNNLVASCNKDGLKERIDSGTQNLTSLAIDLGCGTGIHTNEIAALSARCIAIDISQGMLKSALNNNLDTRTAGNQDIQFCGGDAEALPLRDASVDILHSSMALQWCHSPKQVIAEVKRVLSSKGKAQLAIMLDSSLFELRNAWSQLDIEPRINNFYSQKDWLANITCDSECKVDSHTQRFQEWHSSSLNMLRALKRIGAATKQADSVSSEGNTMKPIGKQELAQLDQQMSKKSDRPNAVYSLSYDILFISIEKC